jgi:hypothetical protein
VPPAGGPAAPQAACQPRPFAATGWASFWIAWLNSVSVHPRPTLMEFISVPADMLEITEDPLGPILHFFPIDVR